MRETNTAYSWKWLIWCFAGLVGLCFAMKFTGGFGYLLIFPFVLVALSKNRPELMLLAMLMTAVVTFGNPWLTPKDSTFSVAARLVYLVVGWFLTMQILGRRHLTQAKPLLFLFVYLFYMALASSVGWMPLISYLKLILFSVVFLAFYSAANASVLRGRATLGALRGVFLAIVSFMVFGSIALIPFPGIGKMGAAQAVEMGLSVESVGLFMGVTNQSQALGPTLGVLGTAVFADLLFSVRRWDRLYIALLLGTVVLLYYTSSRTAMGTFVAGVCFTSFLFVNGNTKRIGGKWKAKAASVLMLLGVLGSLVFFATPSLRDAAIRFIYKTGEQEIEVEEQTFERFTSSRQGLIDKAIKNFKASPWIGNGFQVADHHQYLKIVSWKQLLSAPIEKGVWVYAVLEEGGVFGMALFILFILIALGGMLRHRAFTGACALFAFLVANLGEFGFFSMTTWSGLVWGTIFTGCALDALRERSRNLPPYPMDYYGRRV